MQIMKLLLKMAWFKAINTLFSTLLAKVDATKNAGINGKTTIGGGKKGLADVTVTEPISGKTYVSEKDGFFEITPLTEGKYTLVFSIEGYETQTITSNDVKTGVMKRLNVEMVPMAKPQVKG